MSNKSKIAGKSQFSKVLQEWQPSRVQELINTRTKSDVERALGMGGHFEPENIAALLSPAADSYIEQLAQQASALTRQRFGNAVQFFVPLYVSNYCVNGCRYCGFNRLTTGCVRHSLCIEEAVAEAQALADQGFSHLLLVAGEDRKNTPPTYFVELAKKIHHLFSSIQVEIYSLTQTEYANLVAAGVDGVTMFQESYNHQVYKENHLSGPKQDFNLRLLSIEHAAEAGMTFLGLGTLLGLNNWREEVFYLGMHGAFLQQEYWRSVVSISFPRLRPALGCIPIPVPVSDRDFVHLMCALRLQLPDAVMTLSTREQPGFREQLVKIAVTKISAGAKTTPGGYATATDAEPQFDVADRRTLPEVAAAIAAAGFDPVMKDWDNSYTGF